MILFRFLYLPEITTLNSMKTEISDDDNLCINAKAWTDHFSKLYSVPENKQLRINEINRMLVSCSQNKPNACLDRVISKKEIFEAFKKLKNGKSCGFDGILNEMIKLGRMCCAAVYCKIV